MKQILYLAGALVPALFPVAPALADPVVWGVQVEQLEYRFDDSGDDVLAWDFNARIGSDKLKFVWRSEAEYDRTGSKFEVLENRALLQVPIDGFYDAVAGLRFDNFQNVDRVSGVLGVNGLARQWFEVDANLFLSEDPSARVTVQYEALITNWITVTPSFEIDMPFTDDAAFENGAWGPTIETGIRASYDLIGRMVSPYIGVHYERLFGETANIAEADGKGNDSLFLVAGLKMLF